jgi:hypothetical protein
MIPLVIKGLEVYSITGGEKQKCEDGLSFCSGSVL